MRDLTTGVVFNIGTGFDADIRKRVWEQRDRMVGQIVTYRFKPAGVKEKPRFPSFRMFRSPLDL